MDWDGSRKFFTGKMNYIHLCSYDGSANVSVFSFIGSPLFGATVQAKPLYFLPLLLQCIVFVLVLAFTNWKKESDKVREIRD